MPKDPTHAFFECDSCGHKSGADARMAAHILPFKRKLPIDANGQCRRCGGDRWTISVIYAESDMDVAESALGIGLAATTGLGFVQDSTYSSHLIYLDVPAAVVARINEHPKERLARLGEFVRTMEQGKLKDAGGLACLTCGTLFVPAAGKAWHEAGYCSKVCLVKAEGAAVDPPSQLAESSGQVSGRDGERLVQEFVADVQSDRYRGRIVEFPADGELAPPDRELAFRNLEQLVKSQRWRPAFTSLDVVQGVEDCVTVYLRGGAGEWLVLSAAYHYDANRWKLDSYETSQWSFARPEGESFEDYVLHSIAEVKSVGRPHPGRVAEKDGQYFVEY